VSTLVHTTAPVFGKIMALTQPKHAVAYHFQNDPETLPLMDEIHEDFNEQFGSDFQFPLRPVDD